MTPPHLENDRQLWKAIVCSEVIEDKILDSVPVAIYVIFNGMCGFSGRVQISNFHEKTNNRSWLIKNVSCDNSRIFVN